MRKTLFCFILTFSLFLIFASVAYADTLASVTQDGVVLRDYPEDSAKVLKNLEKNDVVKIIDADGEWFRVQTEAAYAYLKIEQVSITQADAAITSNSVNVRKEASLSSPILEKLSQGKAVTVSLSSGEFYNVTYDGKTGYVHKTLLKGDLLDYVNGNTALAAEAEKASLCAIVNAGGGLNLRVGPGTDYESICKIPNGSRADILAVETEWLKVSYGSYTGYVKTEYVNITLKEALPVNPIGADVVTYAKQFIGTPYAWSGNSLTKGVDCSGFTTQVYKHFGITLNRSSRDQIANGIKISKSELQPGDLVFFDTSGANNGVITHVGIYIGNDNFIHSSSTRGVGVTINSMSEKCYSQQYVSACRVLK